jgi:hypothetical protein
MPVGVIGVVGGGIKELDGAASELAGVVSGRDEGWRGILLFWEGWSLCMTEKDTASGAAMMRKKTWQPLLN